MSDDPSVDTKLRHEITHDGRRLAITLTGGKGNVVDIAMSTKLAEVLRRHTRSSRLRCVTLAAEGKHFSFGASVQEHAPELAPRLLERLHAVVRHVVELDLPVIAAVRGHCLGGGLELVLPCHRIIADPNAKLGQPEIALGMFAPAGSVLLPERIGRGSAEDLLLTGRLVGAEEALAMGLVDQIAEDPEAAALDWCTEHLFTKSGQGLRAAVRAARTSYRSRVRDALARVEHRFLEETLETEDAQEGIASFTEKREARWTDD